MNHKTYAPKSSTEVLFLLTAEITGTIFESTDAKPKKTLEHQVTQLIDTSSFDRIIDFETFSSEEERWMLGLTSWEVYQPVLIQIEQSNIFETYECKRQNDFSQQPRCPFKGLKNWNLMMHVQTHRI